MDNGLVVRYHARGKYCPATEVPKEKEEKKKGKKKSCSIGRLLPTSNGIK